MLTGACRDFVEQVTDALEGRLAAFAATRFWAHAAVCEGCARYLRQIRATVELASGLATASVAPQTDATLRDAFAGWTRARRTSRVTDSGDD